MPMPERIKRVTDQPADEQTHELIDSGLRTLDTETNGIAALSAALQNGLRAPFIAAVELIRGARGRVVTSGMGKSGHVAHSLAATMSSTGTPAIFVHPAEAGHGDLGMITPDDVLMALSWSGETVELKNLIDYSRRFRIGLIAMTSDGNSTLAQAADVAFVLPQAREACPHNLAPTTSALMQLVLGDALAVALLEARGFTAVEFGTLHPGGRLGAMLKFVRHLMHTGDAVPQVPLGTDLTATIAEMSAKGFGCTAVVEPTTSAFATGIKAAPQRKPRPIRDIARLMVKPPRLGSQLCRETP